MKKKSIFGLLLSSILVMTGLSSCKNCQTCNYTYSGTTYTEDVCIEDYQNKDAWKAYIKYIEASGAKCK